MSTDGQVFLVVGLPGSGRRCTFHQMDIDWNFLNDYWDGDILYRIDQGEEVCLIDSKLCVASIFDKLVEQLLRNVPRDRLQVVVFDNDPVACIQNSPHRREEILMYSALYCTDYYGPYDPVRLPVLT
jgi:hypothetical protein